jgi:hypothetical protein
MVFNCAFLVEETQNGVMGCPFRFGCGAAESVSSSSLLMVGSVHANSIGASTGVGSMHVECELEDSFPDILGNGGLVSIERRQAPLNSSS